MNWKNTNRNLGTVRVGETVEIKYLANKTLPKIQKLKSSCQCSIPTYNPKTQILTVKFKAGKIPRQLVHQGWYNTRKSVQVLYKNGEKDYLYFSAKVIK